MLDKLKRQLETASRTVRETGVRTRAMERKLRDVEELPESEKEYDRDNAIQTLKTILALGYKVQPPGGPS